MSEAAIGRCSPEIDARVRFYKAAALQPIYLLKEHSSEDNFNGYAKILITHILYRRTV